MYTKKQKQLVRDLCDEYSVKQRATAKRYKHKSYMVYHTALVDATRWLPSDATIGERIYVVLNDVTTRPLCQHCQINNVAFQLNGVNAYRQFCSRKCGNTFKELATQRATNTAIVRKADVVDGKNSFQRYSTFTQYNETMRNIVYSDGSTALTRQQQAACLKAAITNRTLYADPEYRAMRGFIIHTAEFIQYSRQVRLMTEKTWRENKAILDPNNIRSRQYHLDHKYSIREGFSNNIPPYILAHVGNLEIITGAKNLAKHARCSITLDQLFDLVFNC